MRKNVDLDYIFQRVRADATLAPSNKSAGAHAQTQPRTRNDSSASDDYISSTDGYRSCTHD